MPLTSSVSAGRLRLGYGTSFVSHSIDFRSGLQDSLFLWPRIHEDFGNRRIKAEENYLRRR
jgi:hypothetical protein